MLNPLDDYRERLLARFDSVVSELADAIAAIPEAHWHIPQQAGLRSPHAILAHIRNTEAQVYLPRLTLLIREADPMLDLINVKVWEQDHYDPDEPLINILEEYAQLREAELQLLRQLAPADWNRAGRHLLYGVRTVQWWAERALAHTIEHMGELRGQVEGTLAGE